MWSLIKNERKNILTAKRIVTWSLLILSFPLIKFLLIKDNYVFYRQIEIFQRVNSDFVPLLFPFIMILIYAVYFVPEINNGYVLLTTSRVQLKNYIQSKLITNAIISFLSGFLIVFLPFVFVMYIEPYLKIITLDFPGTNPIPYLLFEQLLNYGILTYGLFYAFWVGINGVLYSSFGFLLLLLEKTPLVAFTLPFIYYIIGHFVAQVLGFDYFSPMLTIFPFSLEIQPIWVIFVPFILLLTIVTVLYFKFRKRLDRSYE